MSNDNLGDRMKGYEDVNRIYLTKRMPLIIRLDGNAFHSFCKGFEKPSDSIFVETMNLASLELAASIEGSVIAYIQSDEVSLCIVVYKSIHTDPWFGKNLQKIVSVSASIMTRAFNKWFRVMVDRNNVDEGYKTKIDSALFDSRSFVIPKEEVVNYFIWRQQDATRNSINSLAQVHFSHAQLLDKNTNQVQEMLYSEKQLNWNNFPTSFKRGRCAVRFGRCWGIDNDIPIFSQDRDYIEKLINF